MNLKPADQLLNRYLQGECTPEEKQLVERWYDALEELGDMPYNQEERDVFRHEMKEKLYAAIAKEGIVQAVPVVSLKSRRTSLWWAAAAILVILFSAIFLLNRQPEGGHDMASIPASQDVPAPQTNRASVRLSNGQVVYLDSVSNGAVMQEAGMEMVKLANGEIVYKAGDGTASDVVAMNTLVNPRGSRAISLTLADGTKVWLNAGATITYPVAFRSGERRVEMTGEAYFEVAHNAAAPFTVSVNTTEVQVLGTEFNVNANQAAAGTAVTLVNGSVRLASGAQRSMLRPGEQARVSDNSIAVSNQVDLDAVLAWKNGIFSFDGTSFDEMMQEIGRWYDVDIAYASGIPERRFGGKMHRSANLSEVLQVLKESEVHYRLEGKKLTITK